MSMTKKHYEAIANALSHVMWDEKSDPATMSNVIWAIAKVCEIDNPRFDRSKFFTACTNNPSTK